MNVVEIAFYFARQKCFRFTFDGTRPSSIKNMFIKLNKSSNNLQDECESGIVQTIKVVNRH